MQIWTGLVRRPDHPGYPNCLNGGCETRFVWWRPGEDGGEPFVYDREEMVVAGWNQVGGFLEGAAALINLRV